MSSHFNWHATPSFSTSPAKAIYFSVVRAYGHGQVTTLIGVKIRVGSVSKLFLLPIERNNYVGSVLADASVVCRYVSTDALADVLADASVGSDS